MRAALLLLVACAAPRPAPAPPVAAAVAHRSCTEAAVGLEASTQSIRPPDRSILKAMQVRCETDRWPVAAIDCFADMTETSAPELLGRCMTQVPEPARTNAVAELADTVDTSPAYTDAQRLADLGTQLSTLSVGIAECDHFVASVAHVLGCEAMPVDERLDLGQETASFWSLPTEKLPVSARDRMTRTCTDARTRLELHATQLGCQM
ncbi:MAG TPA: hypothetical protein VGM88_22755 [Kofleriaceae bacterium]|jgi:hypothetical protein